MTKDETQQQTSQKAHSGVDETTSFNGWATAGDSKLHKIKFSPRVMGPKDVEINIVNCGVCASDIYVVQEDWYKLHGEIVPGHEITGIVVAAGAEAWYKVGDRVGATVIVSSAVLRV